jgi:hypothetical protein
MRKVNELPIIKRKKKIDVKKFVALAKKVRKSFEEEERYFEKKGYGNNNPTRLFLNTQ